ncbi:MAG: hydrogen gas-evolving membrane-bound hydrogenase subunit E, partial [Anaerolineae bacterium]|nr:hydrogen gas-evolving membrane-bound hydrogenase subunit E [Anaerolineae bacterium]
TNALTIIAAGLVTLRVFFGPKVETPKHAHEAPWSMLLGPVTLSTLGLILGLLTSEIAGDSFSKVIVGPAVSGILAEPTEVKLHLFPSYISPTLILSIITIALGGVLYYGRDPLTRLAQPLNVVTNFGPEQWYKWILDGMLAVARFQTTVLQNGYLRLYLITVILTTVILTGYTLFTLGGLIDIDFIRIPNANIYETLIYITIVAAAIVVTRTRSRLTAVAALGVVGYGIALIFILFSAPDLAMTQFSIETLSVILLVLVLYRLPTFSRYSTMSSKARDMIVAGATGALMTILILVVTAFPAQSRLTPYFAANSLLKAKGHNVVNVILVDFRGIDTMGEITVLGIAAIGVYSLLKLRMGKGE